MSKEEIQSIVNILNSKEQQLGVDMQEFEQLTSNIQSNNILRQFSKEIYKFWDQLSLNLRNQIEN